MNSKCTLCSKAYHPGVPCDSPLAIEFDKIQLELAKVRLEHYEALQKLTKLQDEDMWKEKMYQACIKEKHLALAVIEPVRKFCIDRLSECDREINDPESTGWTSYANRIVLRKILNILDGK